MLRNFHHATLLNQDATKLITWSHPWIMQLCCCCAHEAWQQQAQPELRQLRMVCLHKVGLVPSQRRCGKQASSCFATMSPGWRWTVCLWDHPVICLDCYVCTEVKNRSIRCCRRYDTKLCWRRRCQLGSAHVSQKRTAPTQLQHEHRAGNQSR